jgi:hypothetical protein
MFGGHAFGDAAFSDKRGTTINLFFGFGLSIDFAYRIRVATAELIDPETLQPYADTLDEALDFTWSLPLTGGFITGRGSTVLGNLDGRYDTLTQRYTTDAQPIEIRLGAVGLPQSAWPVVLKGLSSGEFIDDAKFEISVEDNAYKLDVPAQAAVYSGAGGLDGNADLAGKPLPLCFGWVLNVAPPLVVPNELLYQVHDGAVQAITAVYDQGVLLTAGADYATAAALRAATIAAGSYATCLAQGYFRLNSVPNGAVTADLQGDVSDGDFAETTVDIIRALIGRATEVADPGDFYLPALDALDRIQPAPVGIYIGHDETPSVADIVGRLITAIGAFAGFRHDGKFYVGRIDLPEGPPVKRFDKYNFDPNPQKQKLPDGVWPPPAKWLIGYRKNYTVMTDPAGAVSDDRRSFLAAEYRYATAEAPSVRLDHPFGKDPDPVPGFFRDKTDADAEATRRLALWRRSLGSYAFGVSDRDAVLFNAGDQVFVRHTRGDLTVGRYMMIFDKQLKASTQSATIKAFG